VGDLGVFLACILGAYILDLYWWERAGLVTSEHLPREDAIQPLTPGTCRMGWRWGVLALGPLRTDRQLTLLRMTFTVQTARLVLGGGAGVRLVVDSVPPLGRSV
jgi:hypothetical protein